MDILDIVHPFYSSINSVLYTLRFTRNLENMSYKISWKKIYLWIIFSSFMLGCQTMQKCMCRNFGEYFNLSCGTSTTIQVTSLKLGHSAKGCEDATQNGCHMEFTGMQRDRVDMCNGKSSCAQFTLQQRNINLDCNQSTTQGETIATNYALIYYKCVNDVNKMSNTSSEPDLRCSAFTKRDTVLTIPTGHTTFLSTIENSNQEGSETSRSSPAGLVIGITIAVIVLVVGVTLFLVFYWKRRRQEKDDSFGTMTEQNNYIEIQDTQLDQNIKPFVNKTYVNAANGVRKDHNETLPEVNKTNLTNDDEYHTINELETPGEGKCNGSENQNQMEAAGAKSSSHCDYAKPLKQKKNGGMKKDDIPGKTTTEPTYLMMENDEYESSGNVINDMQGPLEPNIFGDTENGKTPGKFTGVSAVSVKNTEECDYDTPLSTNPPDFTDENVDYELNGSMHGAINTGKSIQASECSNSGSNTNNIEKTETGNVDMMVENDEYQTSDEVHGHQNGPPQEEPQYFILEDSNTGENDEVTMVENNYYTSSEVTGPEEPKPEENPYML